MIKYCHRNRKQLGKSRINSISKNDTNTVNERKRIYEKIRDELTQSQRSNAEHFDSNVLTLSSAGLGISVAFIDKIIKLSEASFIFLLYISWVLFIITIIITLVSYIKGQKGIKLQLHFAEKYYLDEDESYLLKENKYAKFVDKYSSWVILFFIFSIIFLIIFLIININKGELKMNESNKGKKELLIDSVAINDLQKVKKNDLIKSAPINNLQPIQKPNNSEGIKNNNKTSSSKSKK